MSASLGCYMGDELPPYERAVAWELSRYTKPGLCGLSGGSLTIIW
jgi:hypothetical protein